MATVNLTIQDRGLSGDSAVMLLHPIFFGLSDDASSRDWAMLGATIKVLGAIADGGLSVDAAAFGRSRGFGVVDVGRSADTALLVVAPQTVVSFDLIDVGASADVGTLSYVALFAIADIGISVDLADFAPAIPVVRRPEPGETWGTVNLVRNPSLEYDAVGLTDWSAGAGIALTRTSAAEAWSGVYSGRAAVAAASGTPQLIIRSQAGLDQRGTGRRWVGSAELRGDADTVTMWLELAYTDATGTIGPVLTIDSTSDVPLSDTVWQRYATEPVDQDLTKTLDRLDLVFALPAHATLERILRIDGVQSEEALSGGFTAYVDGDQGPGHYWVGTPGFSISARETA